MSAPAPAVGVVPTSATTKRIEAQAELTGLQRKLNAIPAAIERLDERIAAGDQAAIQEQARLRVEALHLPGKIAVLEPRVRALVADEERLRLTLFAERQQREYAESREAVASTFAALRGALYDAAVKAGFHRRNVEVLARREAALHLGEPERERIVRSRDSAAAYVLKFAEALSRHLDGLPTPERELLDRVTDAEMGDAPERTRRVPPPIGGHMATEPTKPTPAQELHATGFEPLKQRLQPEFDAARGTPLDPSVHGRAVGARPVATPIVTERIFQLQPDNGSDRDIAKP